MPTLNSISVVCSGSDWIGIGIVNHYRVLDIILIRVLARLLRNFCTQVHRLLEVHLVLFHQSVINTLELECVCARRKYAHKSYRFTEPLLILSCFLIVAALEDMVFARGRCARSSCKLSRGYCDFVSRRKLYDTHTSSTFVIDKALKIRHF